MIQIESVESLLSYRENLTGTIGFIPTMGALHTGHVSLISRARQENDHVIVSIFVNPTQFLEGEDFTTYPRKLEADLNVCTKAGADALFLPTPSMMYHDEEPTLQAPPQSGYILEGHRRPGHFDGVLQIVNKFFNLIRPTRAYFGKKDAQQLILIENMIKTLFIPVQIMRCETVRSDDGLALSSRNAYLSPEEYQQALLISRSLKSGGKKIMSGCTDSKEILETIRGVLTPLDVEYIHITDHTLRPINRIQKENTLILIAARVGKTRLIDNLWI